MQRTKVGRVYLGLAAVVAASVPVAQAQLLVRIGEADGFGYGGAPGFLAANAGPANPSGGILNPGDFLPDINVDGFTQAFGGDDFDHRSVGELANTSITLGVGVADAGSLGSKWTDVSISDSYATSQGASAVHVGGDPIGGNVFGPGGAAPAPALPGFLFKFSVLKTDIDAGAPVYFNMVYGDYDTVVAGGAAITFSYPGTGAAADVLFPVPLNLGLGTQDGRVDGSFLVLSFAKVFSDGGTTWDGWVDVDFTAAGEPYLGFDYAELSTEKIAVPEASTMAISGLAALGMVAYAARRRMALR